jgi:hypothetical protein
MFHDSGKSIAEDDTKLADPKVFMEAMMSEMRRVMKMEMEQVHERIDHMKIEVRSNHKTVVICVERKEFRRGRSMKSSYFRQTR